MLTLGGGRGGGKGKRLHYDPTQCSLMHYTIGNTGFPSPIINLLDVYNHIIIFTANTQANT